MKPRVRNIACVLLLSATSALAQNIVVNGGFEGPGGWTVSTTADCTGAIENGHQLPCGYYSDQMLSYDGSYALAFANYEHPLHLDALVTQELATVPGTSYILSFYVAHCLAAGYGCSLNNQLYVLWGTYPVIDKFAMAEFDYTPYSSTVWAATAVTPLTIGGHEYGNWFFLDDFSVVPVPTRSLSKATVQPPIDADGSSKFSARRRAIPVKFSLTENALPTCALLPATIWVFRISEGSVTPIAESVYSTPANIGSNFRIDSAGCQYVYNVATSSLGPGKYRIYISVEGALVGDTTGRAVVGEASFALE